MRDQSPWARLSDLLGESGGRDVLLTHEQIERIIGRPLPASARRHAAFWSNSSSYAKAWRSAGYEVSRRGLLPDQVRFLRRGTGPVNPKRDTALTRPDVVLVGCVKSKHGTAAAARELYDSPLFFKRRAYAESHADRWFVLSAEHGLVRPDTVIAPYDLALADQSSAYRTAWGEWVTARLQLELGDLSDRSLEVHAGGAYADALQAPMARHGARLRMPLEGLRFGEQLGWYDHGAPAPSVAEQAVSDLMGDSLGVADAPRLAALLRNQWSSSRLCDLQPEDVPALPGLYSWFVDEAGAQELSRVYREHIEPGLIYAGQAGATRWPSGKRSANTLRARVIGMHLRGNVTMSTFRMTLASGLGVRRNPGRAEESSLTEWMLKHLAVVTVPVSAADQLGAVEAEVLALLDPPVNLSSMQPTALRRSLTLARREFARTLERAIAPEPDVTGP